MTTFVIAEAGVNHGGDITAAYRLIHEAKKAGANACKFQLFNSQKLWGDNRIKDYELTYDQIEELKEECERVSIDFLCTPFDVEAVQFLAPLVKRMKIASGCRKQDILEAVAQTGIPVIMSTGMADYDDIEDALEYVSEAILLHCTSSYPCSPKDVNLMAMVDLQETFNCEVGYSDHTDGILAPIIAVSLGASVIEKHLTLNRRSIGPDHLSSIEPHDFKLMVDQIREVEIMLGSNTKQVLPCELDLRSKWYKS